MNRRVRADCVSDWLLDSLLASELGPQEAEQCCAHVRTCSACTARLEDLRAQQEAFQAATFIDRGTRAQANSRSALGQVSTPKQPLPPEPGQRPPGASPKLARPAFRHAVRWWPETAAAAAAALFALWVGMGPIQDDAATSSLEVNTRPKGTGPSLGYVVRRHGQVSVGRIGVPLQPDDALRFTVSQDTPSYVVVLSRDAQGDISRYHPPGGSPPLVESGKRVPLASAVELDDKLGTERVFAVFCRSVPDVRDLERAIRQQPGHPQFPQNCRSSSLLLEKQSHVGSSAAKESEQ